MRILWLMVAILLLIVGILAYLLFAPLPRQPVTPTPTTTVPEAPATTTPSEPHAPAPLHERVKVSAPAEGATVGNTFEVIGEAPGNWYFEASFPIQVRDQAGNVLARTHGTAQGEWMTTEQVPFKAAVTLENFYAGPATLILMRDNPSGLPENDDSLEVPVIIQ